MKSLILASLAGIAAAQQVDLDYFNDPFFTFQQAITSGGDFGDFMDPGMTNGTVEIFVPGFPAVASDATASGIIFDRTMTLYIPVGTVGTCCPPSSTVINEGIYSLNIASGTGSMTSILEYSFQEPLDLSGFDHLKMLLVEADAGYTLTISYCSGPEMCSSFLLSASEEVGQNTEAIFRRDQFVGNAELDAIESVTITVAAPPSGDVSVGTLTTIYYNCNEQALNMAISANQNISEGCFFGEGLLQNPMEVCEVCCFGPDVVNSCTNFTCTEPAELQEPGVWVGDSTCEAIIQGDPHLTGFNGEKMDIAHDASFKNGQLLNMFCSGETSFFAELASTESGDVYITSVFGKYEGLAFSMNIFNEVRVSTDLTYVDESERKHFVAGSSQITVSADGASLSSDDSKVKITVAARAQNGVEYLDVQLASLAGRYQAGGMLGRTLNGKVADADFAEYSDYIFSVDELATFTCEL